MKETQPNPQPRSKPSNLNADAIAKAHSSEALSKRRATYAYRVERRKEDIRRLYVDRQMVPLAIADNLGLKISTVARYLRELVSEGVIEPIPPWLTLTTREPRDQTKEPASEQELGSCE